MADERIQQEMLAADQLRAAQRQRSAARHETLGRIWDGVYAAMADINRRVFEEPWFGRPVQDVLHNIHSRAKDTDKDRLVEQDKGPGHDYDPAAFYGHGKDTQQQDYQQQRELGLER